MKKIVFVLLIIVFVLLIVLSLLAGCSTEEGMTSPSLLRVGDPSKNNGYCYLVDENTGVVYLVFDSGYRHSVTVMVNADGAPMMAEQLGIEY